jgi:hypothetical protein
LEGLAARVEAAADLAHGSARGIHVPSEPEA